MSSSVASISHTRVRQALYNASARTGVDFDYLFRQARIESSLNPDARSSSSSATGLFQFIEQSWLATIARHGKDHGLGWAAAAITKGGDGRFRIADPATRQAVLDLRRDPAASASMAAAFANDNRQHLEARLGHAVEAVDLYLAHFLGARGATNFLKRFEAAPESSAAAMFPAAAKSNARVFFHRDGSPKTLAEVRTHFAAKFAVPGHAAPLHRPQWAQIAPPRAAAVAEARLTYLMLASMAVSA